LTDGLLVIGEGTSWKDQRALGDTMVKTAARGIPVLCLAPADGMIPLPGAEGIGLPAPGRLAFRGLDVITELDKRLAAAAWPPDGQIVASRLAIKADRDDVVAEATKDERGWSWIEARYPPGKGVLLICGFGIIRDWDAGPAPRYLLSKLFDTLTGEKQASPPPSDERKD
jgi:hypothetical protein